MQLPQELLFDHVFLTHPSVHLLSQLFGKGGNVDPLIIDACLPSLKDDGKVFLNAWETNSLEDSDEILTQNRVCTVKVSVFEQTVKGLTCILQASVQLLEDCLVDIVCEQDSSVTNVCIHMHNKVVVADWSISLRANGSHQIINFIVVKTYL